MSCSVVMVRVAACVVSPLLGSLPALGNQTHYRNIELHRVLAASDAVVVARPQGPPRMVLEEITPPGEKPNADKWPAFSHAVHRYQIDQVPFDRTLTLAAGSAIDVDAADWQSELAVHKMYYLEGRAKSPLYERYQTTATFTPGEPRVVFLKARGDGFSFAVRGAEAKRSVLRQIAAALQKKAADSPARLAAVEYRETTHVGEGSKSVARLSGDGTFVRATVGSGGGSQMFRDLTWSAVPAQQLAEFFAAANAVRRANITDAPPAPAQNDRRGVRLSLRLTNRDSLELDAAAEAKLLPIDGRKHLPSWGDRGPSGVRALSFTAERAHTRLHMSVTADGRYLCQHSSPTDDDSPELPAANARPLTPARAHALLSRALPTTAKLPSSGQDRFTVTGATIQAQVLVADDWLPVRSKSLASSVFDVLFTELKRLGCGGF